MHNRTHITVAATLVVLSAATTPARAQAPESGPILLRIAASTRAAALGNAWVTGRDEDAIFYNPAQIVGATRGGVNVTFAHFGQRSKLGSMSGAYAAGPMSFTIGWGMAFANYSAPTAAPYPFAPELLTTGGSDDAFGLLLVGGGAITLKGFRIGVAGKYASDRVGGFLGTDGRHDAILGDVGIARSIFGGTMGLSVQNLRRSTLGNPLHVPVPQQASIGYSTTLPAGPLDLGLYTQVTSRNRWVAPGGGIEAGYSWIEGYAVALRVGARRPETKAERPVAFGAAFSADHLTLDYAFEPFDGGHAMHRVTARWR